ncbi:hypothetical protein GCM10017600_72060 [Streptosporangium carneum]|uniref:DUF2079 domain-containing protein n=1 Tax=Streptosporangium carneum TaxID=47481 RepID=A0A9W6MH45_9ACTN|nr:hypothetical protein GCM10017600_72060 [Streptosporangium carneum]
MTTAAEEPVEKTRETPDLSSFVRLRRHGLTLGALVALAATAYTVLGLVKLSTFKASIFDLAIFDQAVRGYAHFGPPAAPTVGMFYGQGMDFLQLADHFSPILVVLAPLYWIHDGPETLIVAQAALLALAAVPVWHYAERRLGPVSAHLVAAAYLVSWPVAQVAGFDFHEVAFVPLLSAIMIERADAGRMRFAIPAALGILLVKEDMGLLVAGFGVYLFVTRRRIEGAGFVLFGLGALMVIRGVLMPLLGSAGAGFHWAYGNWGTTLGEVALGVARDPLGALWQMVSPEVKVDTLAFLLWPMLLTALLSPLVLVAVPLVAERFLADRPQWWGPDYQYNAFVVAILVCAAVDGVHRLAGWLTARSSRKTSDRPSGQSPEDLADEPSGPPSGSPSPDRPARRFSGRELTGRWAFAVCVIGLTLVPRFALGNLLESSFYEGEPYVAAAREAVAKVPDGVVVEAANNVGPALTARTTVLLWGPQAHGAPWIVADVARWTYPFGAPEVQQQRVDEALRTGYVKVYDRDGYVVLNRPS